MFLRLLLISFISSIMVINIFPQFEKKCFINGKIFTVNESQPYAEAVIVIGNKIAFVGSNEEAQKYINDKTDVIDLQGKLMLPGFIDNHTHFITGGRYLLGIDLRPAKSTDEFKKILKEYADAHPGKWISGGYWDHEQWEVNDLPTKEMIDAITPNTPVLVSRLDGHMALTNSYTLKLAGITKDTPNPDGGWIEKDPATGEPTGILKDNAMGFVSKLIPPPSEEEYYEAALAALQEAREQGITGIHDITHKQDFITFQKLEQEGKLTCRIFTRFPIYEYQQLANAGIKVGFGSELLKVGSLKAFADGSLGSSTALFYEPYDQDTTTVGLAMEYVTDGNLRKWSIDADKNNLQLSIHAIGDSANAIMLDMFEEIINTNPKWDRRFRIEHAQHVRFKDIPRFKELGVIASAQPYHCIDDGGWAEKRIGPERIKYTYPFRSFLDAGVKLCFGSDWYVAPFNVIYGIYAAVTRRTLDGLNPDGWVPEQKITVEEAIKCYTLNSAFASFEEDIKGSIEPGKLADLIVLGEDILTIEPEKIIDVKVDMTVFDGKIVFKR